MFRWCHPNTSCGISDRFQPLSPSERQVAHVLLTRPPLSHIRFHSEEIIRQASFDLHVLGTPPAFILSQDQTLMFKFVRSKSVWLILPFYCCFRFLFSEISLRTFCSVWNFQGCITVYLSRCCSSYWKCFQKNFRSCRSDSLLSLS